MLLVDRLITTTLPLVPKPLVRVASRPYIAGETVDDLIAAITNLNSQGYMAAASMLGEFVEHRGEAETAVQTYLTVLSTDPGATARQQHSRQTDPSGPQARSRVLLPKHPPAGARCPRAVELRADRHGRLDLHQRHVGTARTIT